MNNSNQNYMNCSQPKVQWYDSHSHGIMVFFFLLLLSIVPSAYASQSSVTCEILQYKLDRLYFSCGVESGIYPYCRFFIKQDSDTIYTGCIEASYPGISYSFITNDFFDSLAITSYSVQLQPATIDSVSSIILGDVGTKCYRRANDTGRIGITSYESLFEMGLDFESGKLDGFFSFSRHMPPTDSIDVTTFSAPYYIALVPNPSRLINASGFLSASLYYRFTPSLIGMVFPGDKISPFNCLTLHPQLCERPYPYNPQYGKTLLRHISRHPQRISIGVSHHILQPVAEYFADILSRDHIRTTIRTDTNNADLYLLFVPLAPNDTLISLEYLLQFLAKDTTTGNPVNETITIIRDYLHAAQRTSDPEIRAHYCRLAEISLRDDIGVYPLFRPTIFYTHYRYLAKIAPDKNGIFDVSRLMKYHIADSSLECSQ